MEDIAYTISEFCQISKTSRAKLYQLWSEGKGPKKFKIGRRVLISDDAIRSWIKQLENSGGE